MDFNKGRKKLVIFKEPDRNFYSDVAFEIWRLTKRIQAAKKDNPQLDIAAVEASAARLTDLLRREKIDIQDPTGQRYNEGLAVEVLEFEKSESLPVNTKVIVETLRPTIYFDGNVLVRAQVIVATSIDQEKA